MGEKFIRHKVKSISETFRMFCKLTFQFAFRKVFTAFRFMVQYRLCIGENLEHHENMILFPSQYLSIEYSLPD